MTDDDLAEASEAQRVGDHATALSIYRQWAEQGDAARPGSARACSTKRHSASRKSYVEAVKWYRRAADQGYADAQNNLGVMYESGHGVPRDPVEAAKWYFKAAEQGDANAQHNLGNRFQSGDGVPQNYAAAIQWYRKAAEQMHPMAQANLGVMYERGHGTRQDFVQAQMWFMLSASCFRASEAKNRGLVIRNRDQLAAKMTPGTDRGSTPARARVAAIADDDALTESVREETAAVYRAESRRVFATLVRLLGDFDLAEEALHDAFAPRSSNGRATACRPIRARGSCRPAASRRSTASAGAPGSTRSTMSPSEVEAIADDAPRRGTTRVIEDDRLRLIFTCCHPALAPEAQVALTLREVCGLATEEIAQAFLRPRRRWRSASSARRRKIRDARIPYQVPAPDELPERLASALRVIYLVFNEGYSPSSGAVADAGRPVRRGDPPRDGCSSNLLPEPEAHRTAGADAAAGIAARGTGVAERRDHPASRPGPLALEPRPDRRRRGAGGTGARVATVRPLHAAGGDRRRPRRGARAPTPRTGTRSSGSTTSCCAPSPRPSSSSIARWRWRCAMARRRPRADRRDPCPRRARRTTTSPMPRGPTCAAGWVGARKRAPPTSARSSSPGRSPSGGSSTRRLAGAARLTGVHCRTPKNLP